MALSSRSLIGQAVAANAGEAARKAAELAGLSIEAGPAQVLDVVVVRVHAVEGGRGGTELVEIAEVVVDEMREGFERVHGDGL